MQVGKFREWLIINQGMKRKSAGDVISRCRRIEKILGLSIEDKIQTSDGLDEILFRLDDESSNYLSPDTNKIFAVGVLKRAAKLYQAYILEDN